MLRFLLISAIILSSFSAFAAERVVILAPAAGDIIHKLGAEDKIVGITKNLEGFPKAVEVGTHLKPNIEIIKSLKPDLLIAGNGKYFTDEIKAALNIRTYAYDPNNLAEILMAVRDLGKEFGKADIADELEKSLKTEISGLKKPACKVSVFFEVSQTPLMSAGTDSIVSDMVTRAGGYMTVNEKKKVFKTGIETVVAGKPDVYIYQIGPMNKNPMPPQDRNEYKGLKAQYVKVDESEFSRANTNTFKNVKFLNGIFNSYCANH
ncbi:ABC transporter substrate-binding protein [Seleniivibrio sp.]|uniref:ABC transporter substrate-binding protein n=1 Tax=Seleniivibrio sp. TaxID=2898801 RepID=UPI0026007117|nr:ABC transporter substrate-binding protein [Seleniivibrio sp.]MCD8553272.1 ABC transporter substrate-binding protein [Seleniivibrio sp.]